VKENGLLIIALTGHSLKNGSGRVGTGSDFKISFAEQK
jgi:hypothetical protein